MKEEEEEKWVETNLKMSPWRNVLNLKKKKSVTAWFELTPVHVTAEKKERKRKVQGVPQSQTAVLPRHQEEEETDKSKQAQIEQTYVKH